MGFCVSLLVVGVVLVNGIKSKHIPVGPRFIQEPRGHIQFYNSTGAVVSCSASGSPAPAVSWIRQDGSPVHEVPELLQIRPDASLVFAPFRPEHFRQDIHSAVFRCTAANAVGIIASRDVNIRAVIRVKYEIRTSDDYVTKGNTAVLKCVVPSSVKDYVPVISWETEEGFVIQRGTSDGKYRTTTDGSLLIENVDYSDVNKKYRCICIDEMIKESVVSLNWGHISLTEPMSPTAPSIRSGNREFHYRVGEMAELVCNAKGNPPPNYTWYRQEGGQRNPLQSNRRMDVVRSTVHIHKASKGDTATYVCVVNNSVGTDQAHFQIVVSENLRASIYPEKLIVKEGISVTFTCNVSGPQITSLIWTRNLKPVITSARTKLISSEVLQIYSVQREDKGMYQCFVRSHDESYQGSAQLSLEEDPPEFREVFSDRVLPPGSRASLRCLVTGNPLPQVSWRLYSRPVAEGLGVRLGDFVDSQGLLMSFINISSLSPEHGGIYSCHARNEIGAISHSARLSVQGNPYVHPMDNVTVVTGDELNVDCAASGYPLKTIRWRKDNTVLSGGQRSSDHRNGTLSIGQAAKVDQGWYQCEVTGEEGKTAVGSLFVRVVERPVINPFIFGEELMEGMRTMVVCTVLAGEPPISILWLKDGAPLMHTDHRGGLHVTNLGEFASSLTIPAVSRHHAGNYTCLVASGAAQASYTAIMTVKASPKWVKKPTDLEALVNQRVVFTCQAEGIPEPIHRWKYRSGGIQSQSSDFKSVVSSSHMYVLENGSLVIRDVEKEDSGSYLCEASNGVGAALSEVVELHVNLPPRFSQTIETKTIKESQEVTLVCDAHGQSPLVITWKKDQRPLSRTDTRYIWREHPHRNGLRSELLINVVSRTDNGIFQCEASNHYGREEKTINLIVQGKPDRPLDLKELQVTSRQITISWSQPSTGNSPITGYILVYNQSRESIDQPLETVRVSGPKTKVLITGLSPDTTYVFRVHAENELGRSEPSQPLTITTEEEAPKYAPQNIRVIPLSSTTIKVTWNSIPAESGIILQYNVGYRKSQGHPYEYKTVNVLNKEDSEKRKNEALITDLSRNTKYFVTVQGINSKGPGPPSKEIIVQTLQHDPPASPIIEAVEATDHSIDIRWTIPSSNSITGYKLRFQMKSDESPQVVPIERGQTSHTLRGLKCGTEYHISLSATNSAGEGPSNVVVTRTKGEAPRAPEKTSLLSVNSTSALIRLSSWHDGGCPLASFAVMYKPRQTAAKDWLTLSNDIRPHEATVVLGGLEPGTWYDLSMSAVNDVDVTHAEYVFATLTPSGGTVPPLASTSSLGALAILRDPAVLVPIVCAVVVVVVITVVVAVVVLLKRKDATSECRSQGVYSGSSGGKGENLSMSSYGKVKRSDPSDDSQREPLYYPTPYATTQLSTYSESPNTSHCNTLRRHDGKGHEYDIPHRHAQMGEYTSYAKLWTRIHEDMRVDGNVSMAAMKSNNIHLGTLIGRYEDGASDLEDLHLTCLPPHPDSADIDELSETECDRHHNSWIVIRESFEEDLLRRVPHVC